MTMAMMVENWLKGKQTNKQTNNGRKCGNKGFSYALVTLVAFSLH
jgi:hypothetical protein